MDLSPLRALYDREMRQTITYHGAVRQVDAQVVRHVSTNGEGSFVLHSTLDSRTVDAAIETQIAYFTEIGTNFEWKVFDYDQPDDLWERLQTRGFHVEDPEAVMVLDLDSADRSNATRSVDLVQIRDSTRLADVAAVESAVWQQDFTALMNRLQQDLDERPELLDVFVAYVDTQPASAAWTYYHPETSFSSLWGGSTLSQFRGQGLYSALLAERSRRARSRGARFLTVDASPASEPILKKHGFVTIATARACIWQI